MTQAGRQQTKGQKIGCGCLSAVVGLAVIGGCMSMLSDGDGGKAKVSASAPVSKPSLTRTASAHPTRTASVKVPDYTGYDLRKAEEEAKAKGIGKFLTVDLSDRGRDQTALSNWKVCTQEPEAGEKFLPGEVLILNAVKKGESCSDPNGWLDESNSSSTSSSGGSGSSGGGSSSTDDSSSSSSSGGQQAPAGATALCNDGSYSYSAHRRGTCSHHHGVAQWLASLP